MTTTATQKHRPMFPHTIDSTILSCFRACPRKFAWQYLEHWKPNTPSVHLIAGGAFASGIEAARNAFYVAGESSADAEAIGIIALLRHYGDFQDTSGSSKTPERMCGALEYYFSQYPLGADGANPITLADGKRGIEFSFAEPLNILHPVTGDPILYTGRSDMIAERAGGIYGYDEKTTSSLGATWGRQWEMRSQFTGYVWAAAQQGIKLNGFIIRGISILKTKYDTLEIPTARSKHEVSRWEIQIIRDIKRMIAMWEEGYWDYTLDEACTDYGGCAFTQVCKANRPEDWLPISFTQKVWDPLLRAETTVADYEASWGHIRQAGEPPAKGSSTNVPYDSQALGTELTKLLSGGVL